jgi:ABC-type branched-subunit amino acid transport system ATPase component
VADRRGLEVRNLTVAYGGLLAVDDVSFAAPLGRITGLIGPNGAGKTTAFNACSGLLQPRAGVVSLHGTDVTKLSPARRARLGLGRTFQRIELFDSLTVAENVALGREAGKAGLNIFSHVLTNSKGRKEVADATEAALSFVGIQSLCYERAGTLALGQRRLVELARCLAGRFDVLILDEPSSGLTQDEARLFGVLLTTLMNEREIGILIVEHNTALVLDICAHIYVLDFGKLIMEGSPAQVAMSEDVRAVYLGTEVDHRSQALGGGQLEHET